MGNKSIKSNGVQLAELIMKYYTETSDKYKEIISMKRVYMPVVKEQ